MNWRGFSTGDNNKKLEDKCNNLSIRIDILADVCNKVAEDLSQKQINDKDTILEEINNLKDRLSKLEQTMLVAEIDINNLKSQSTNINHVHNEVLADDIPSHENAITPKEIAKSIINNYLYPLDKENFLEWIKNDLSTSKKIAEIIYEILDY